ncbi:MAG: trypsin-like peptidase domain-containing protein [Candidatus Gastranaerophilales bacterium]|nr:trypsin-like peptidase domain-containing protein [Candidatus Gastranaerophilales bacterium]
MHNLKKILTAFFIGIMVFSLNIQNVEANSFFKDEELTISLYEKINPSIVAINADISDGISSGTGCIIAEDGIILTSSHVIEGSQKIEVTLYNGKEYTANVMGIMGEKSDLALLKINCDQKLKIVKLGDSQEIKVGQKVLAIGNPFGFNGTLTTGIISRIDYKRNKIQTDAAINPGSSGGPLLNTNGEVIGINQSIYNPDNNQSNIGIGFAVPVNAAKRFIAKMQSENGLLTVKNESTK